MFPAVQLAELPPYSDRGGGEVQIPPLMRVVPV